VCPLGNDITSLYAYSGTRQVLEWVVGHVWDLEEVVGLVKWRPKIKVMVFSFGQSERERIEVDVLRYERSLVGDYYDDNWLTVEIRVCVGGFHGKAEAAILSFELVNFVSELRPLFGTLSGSAEFTTMEEQLCLRLTGDGKGQIELVGEVEDQAGIGNRLHFSLRFDQSQLGVSIRELEAVTSKFPIRAA
jgi:hypothetical protein